MQRTCFLIAIALLAACGHKTPLTLPPETAPAKKNLANMPHQDTQDDIAKARSS